MNTELKQIKEQMDELTKDVHRSRKIGKKSYSTIPSRVFAIEAHFGQFYGDLPYFHHLDEVAGVLLENGISDDESIDLAYLHDTVEDTDIDFCDIRTFFENAQLASMVWLLTDEVGTNREARKELSYKKINGLLRIRDSLRDAISKPSAAFDYQSAYTFGVYNQGDYIKKAKVVKAADRLANMRNSLLALSDYCDHCKAIEDNNTLCDDSFHLDPLALGRVKMYVKEYTNFRRAYHGENCETLWAALDNVYGLSIKLLLYTWQNRLSRLRLKKGLGLRGIARTTHD